MGSSLELAANVVGSAKRHKVETAMLSGFMAPVRTPGRSSEEVVFSGVLSAALDPRPPTAAAVRLGCDRDNPNDLDLGELLRGDYSDAA